MAEILLLLSVTLPEQIDVVPLKERAPEAKISKIIGSSAGVVTSSALATGIIEKTRKKASARARILFKGTRPF